MTGIGALVVVLLALLVFLILGVPVMFSVLGSALVGFVLYLPSEYIAIVGAELWNSANAPVLAAVPVFILMGDLFSRSSLSSSAFSGLLRVFSGVPGGLVHATVPASTLFAAASGSSVATLATISKVAGPTLVSENYPRRLYMGAQAAGGTLGILIPPSIAMILYGVLSGTSIGDLFLAGIVPGIVLALLTSVTVAVLALSKYRHALPSQAPTSLVRRVSGLVASGPILGVALVVLGSIYLGIATPTESAALGVAMVLILGFAFGGLKPADVAQSVLQATRFSAMLLMIIISASILKYVFAIGGASTTISEIALGVRNEYVLLGLVALVFLILGMALESAAVIAIALPLLLPAVEAFNIDPVLFGVFIVINMEIALLTPPVGLNLFVLKAVYPEATWREIVSSVIPYVVLMFAFLVVLVAYPSIATWLPNAVGH